MIRRYAIISLEIIQTKGEPFMKIKDLIKAVRECTDLTELATVIEEDFGLEISAVEYIDDANAEYYVSGFENMDGATENMDMLIRLWTSDEVLNDEDLLDEYEEALMGKDWYYISDNLEGMFFGIVINEEDGDKWIFGYEDYGYTVEKMVELTERVSVRDM